MLMHATSWLHSPNGEWEGRREGRLKQRGKREGERERGGR